jgi:hypothetical protein
MISDKSLLDWYMKGFNDELRGSSSIVSDSELENKAYRLGALHAIFGDDMKSIDQLTKGEILKQIKK